MCCGSVSHVLWECQSCVVGVSVMCCGSVSHVIIGVCVTWCICKSRGVQEKGQQLLLLFMRNLMLK